MSNAINEIQETIVKFYPVDLENISQSSGNANSVLPIYQNQIIETTLPVAELTCYEPLKTYEVEITKPNNYQPKSSYSWISSSTEYKAISGVLYSCNTDFINNITINSIKNNNKNIKMNNVTQWQADSFLIDKDVDFISSENYVFIPYHPSKKDSEQQEQPNISLSENEFEELILSNNTNNLTNNKNMDLAYGVFILMMLLVVVLFLKKKSKRNQ
jgi:hypothetical protein